MNGLVAVTSAINARLAAVLTLATLPVPIFRFGQDKLRVQETPPRVVWVPKRGPVDSKILPAADYPANWAVAGHPLATPRALWRRVVTCEAHVWAQRDNPRVDLDTDKDYVAAEQLGNHLVAATTDLMWGSYAVTSEDWTTTQASAQKFGVTLVIGFELWFAWAREPDVGAVVTAMPVIPEGA